jgi:hypothetical protein
MTPRAVRNRWSLIVAGLAGLAGVLAAGSAHAQAPACDTDKDCPGTTCGSQVCTKSSGGATCTDANTAGMSGTSDGWCNTTADCKCKAEGATCGGLVCSFTVLPDGGAGGSGGSAGSGGSGTGGSGSGGSASAGTSGGNGGGGGCSVAGAPSVGYGAGIALLAATLMRRRGRRRT